MIAKQLRGEGTMQRALASRTSKFESFVVCRPIVRKLYQDNHRGKLYRWSYAKLWEDVRVLFDDYLPEAKTLDLHSARRATATALERSRVPESLAAAILGHKHGPLTYGLYSSGPSDEQMLEVAESVAEYFAGSD
jgi:hypothetical protein